ncbi:MAG: DUF4007 family protein [Spirulinaceae cyanobacterium SM2_1_0]|nr:DUF4007 family protein [Spirulinaceae cyanobacterium SM2_1_0]
MAPQLSLDIGATTTKAAAVFARHETFPPRFGWLKKGFDHASHNSQVFLADDATVRLGVGKNMVRSIRYWCAAFKLLADDAPTPFGEQLLGDRGWDPYLEDPASLWLLHWQLLQAPCLATTWRFVFNEFQASEFTEERLRGELTSYAERLSSRTAASSLKKDVSCLLRMYLSQPPARKKQDREENLDCPFAELGLLQQLGDTLHIGFRVGVKPSLAPAVVAYTSLHQAARNVSGRTIPASKLLFAAGSPGLVFKLTESALCQALVAIAHDWPELSLVETAGKLQFSFATDDPRGLADAILESYYADC